LATRSRAYQLPPPPSRDDAASVDRSIIGAQRHPDNLVYLPAQFSLFRWPLRHRR